MKRLPVSVFFLWAMIYCSSTAMAGDCYSDQIVKRWIAERDRAEEHVVRQWAKGASLSEFTSEIAVILANELNLCSKCRNDKGFLRGNLHILGKESDPKVETVPGMILQRLLGYDMLSPRSQFPSAKRGGVATR